MVCSNNPRLPSGTRLPTPTAQGITKRLLTSQLSITQIKYLSLDTKQRKLATPTSGKTLLSGQDNKLEDSPSPKHSARIYVSARAPVRANIWIFFFNSERRSPTAKLKGQSDTKHIFQTFQKAIVFLTLLRKARKLSRVGWTDGRTGNPRQD